MTPKTDWALYYANPFPAARWSRMIVRNHLRNLFRRAGTEKGDSVAELGGGGSCFSGALRGEFGLGLYTVYDNCREGLDLFARENPGMRTVFADLEKLDSLREPKYDVVFSVGLAEHFSDASAETVVRKHFELVKPGGTVILFVPSPTLLYRGTRGLAEMLGLWRFPDERPMTPEKLLSLVTPFGTVCESRMLRANFLTQFAVRCRKEHGRINDAQSL